MGGEDVVPRQRSPHVGQRLDPSDVGPGGDPATIDRADRCANDQIRRYPGLGQTKKHPDLDCTQARTPGEHECCSHVLANAPQTCRHSGTWLPVPSVTVPPLAHRSDHHCRCVSGTRQHSSGCRWRRCWRWEGACRTVHPGRHCRQWTKTRVRVACPFAVAALESPDAARLPKCSTRQVCTVTACRYTPPAKHTRGPRSVPRRGSGAFC